ncbi:hypothetical protein LIER_06629 [Lithospermum erythrorhizon]|uniref:Uncharacterized protein n=1 Tax=Lithospermum erythrorhizon TaxID=34254 RepID=A0AAV3P5H0_LITER
MREVYSLTSSEDVTTEAETPEPRRELRKEFEELTNQHHPNPPVPEQRWPSVDRQHPQERHPGPEWLGQRTLAQAQQRRRGQEVSLWARRSTGPHTWGRQNSILAVWRRRFTSGGRGL